jgi:hypothetical protein
MESEVILFGLFSVVLGMGLLLKIGTEGGRLK